MVLFFEVVLVIIVILGEERGRMRESERAMDDPRLPLVVNPYVLHFVWNNPLVGISFRVDPL